MKIVLLSIFVSLLSISTFASTSFEDFAKLPMFTMPSLSPDGESIAYITTINDQPTIVTRALVKKDSKRKVGVIPLKGLHVNSLQWVNDDRLLIKARMTVKRYRVGLINITRFFSVGRDGSNVIIFDMEPNERGYFAQHPRVIDALPSDPNHVLLALDHHPTQWGATLVHKVNVNTGKKTVEYRNQKGFSWVLPDNSGSIRIGVKGSRGGKKWSIFYRGAPDSPWVLLQRTSYQNHDRMRPLRFDYEDNNILLMTSAALEDDDYDQNDDDIYRYDLTQQKIVGPYVHSMRKKAKRTLEDSFPDKEIDLISWLDDVSLDKAIYKIHSDTQAPQYYIFDFKAKRVDYLGSSYPQLEEVVLSPMQEVSYLARDGLNIPAYLTLPQENKGSGTKPPLVVYPHGGPWARDYWGFNNYVQFFANQGYAVFQPQFRGSVGFGIEHLEAGYKQWGLAIQNDITDGVKWLISEGKVDPERICIVGGSFGGYATAMGLAKTPELYKCGISVNGVLDMKRHHGSLSYLLYAALNKEVINSEWGIKKVSPYHLRKQIKAPLLLIAGEKDTVVDNKHSKSLYKKLKKQGNTVEYIELPRGEHWRSVESNEITTMKAVGEFLQTYLGDSPKKDIALSTLEKKRS